MSASRQHDPAAAATTTERVVVPVPPPAGAEKILPCELARYEENGYGGWRYAPGLAAERRLDLLPAATTRPRRPPVPAPALLRHQRHPRHRQGVARPGDPLRLQGRPLVGLLGVMLYTHHVLDAAVQTINALHKGSDRLRHLARRRLQQHAVQRAALVHRRPRRQASSTPSSGAHARCRPLIDYQTPYKAAGLDKSIPWYQAIGNHDHFWMGSMPRRRLPARRPTSARRSSTWATSSRTRSASTAAASTWAPRRPDALR